MYLVLTILIILACVLLVLAVLIQNPKGGGLAVGFSSSNQVMGVRKTTDFLEKFTWGLLISLFAFCLISTIILPSGNQQNVQSQLEEKAANATSTPVQTSPPAANPSSPQPVPPGSGIQPLKPTEAPPQGTTKWKDVTLEVTFLPATAHSWQQWQAGFVWGYFKAEELSEKIYTLANGIIIASPKKH